MDCKEWEEPSQQVLVVQGICDGFRIGFESTNYRNKKARQNMQSALEHPNVIQDYLKKEYCKDRVLPSSSSYLFQGNTKRYTWKVTSDSGFVITRLNNGINPRWRIGIGS